MQAVILASGLGTRMRELTATTPKSMLMVSGKTLLDYKFDILVPVADEIILVVGYLRDVIQDAYGNSYKGIPIRYVVQEELNGTMGALALTKPFLTGRFVVMMGDDIYSADDLRETMRSDGWGMLVEQTEHMAAGGKIVTNDAGTVVAIEEGDHRGTPGLMNTNMFVLDPRVFEYSMVPKSAGSDEYGLPQTVLEASKESGILLHAVFATDWIQITAPEDIALAETRLSALKSA